MKEYLPKIFILILTLTISACETTKLWKGTPEDEYVKVVPQAADEDVEAALKASGREYRCQMLYESSYPNNKICYAKLTLADKQRQIGTKLLKTPETLVIDVGHPIEVIAYIALHELYVKRGDHVEKATGR